MFLFLMALLTLLTQIKFVDIFCICHLIIKKSSSLTMCCLVQVSLCQPCFNHNYGILTNYLFTRFFFYINYVINFKWRINENRRMLFLMHTVHSTSRGLVFYAFQHSILLALLFFLTRRPRGTMARICAAIVRDSFVSQCNSMSVSSARPHRLPCLPGR